MASIRLIPRKDPAATRYETITHADVLTQGLKVMDAAAIALAQEGNIPIIVFSIHESDTLVSVLKGEGRATIVSD